MSAAATAAGYLYASGRLRGRGAKDQQQELENRPERKKDRERPQLSAPRERVKVAVYEPQEKEKPRRAPKIEYRTRRWRPGNE